jgi:hypothetical protein
LSGFPPPTSKNLTNQPLKPATERFWRNTRRGFDPAVDYQRHLDTGTVPEFVRRLVSTAGLSEGGMAQRCSVVSGETVLNGSHAVNKIQRNIFPAEVASISVSTWNTNGLLGASCVNGK